MKTIALFLAMALTANAAPFHRKPATKPPAPAVAPAVVQPAVTPLPLPEAEIQPFTVNPDGSVTRSKQADAELKDWIEGIQREGVLQQGRGDKAEAALGQATSRADTLQGENDRLTADRNAQAKAKDDALAERDAERVAKEREKVLRVAAEHHVSKIKTWLSVVLAGLLILALNMLLSGALINALPWTMYARIAGSIGCAALAWGFVARFV